MLRELSLGCRPSSDRSRVVKASRPQGFFKGIGRQDDTSHLVCEVFRRIAESLSAVVNKGRGTLHLLPTGVGLLFFENLHQSGALPIRVSSIPSAGVCDPHRFPFFLQCLLLSPGMCGCLACTSDRWSSDLRTVSIWACLLLGDHSEWWLSF